jgi:hypothetical protein
MIIPTISIPRIIPSVKFRQKFSVLSHLLHFHPVGGTITPLPTCCRSIAYALMFLSATRALNYSDSMIIPTISIPRIIPSVKFRQKFSVLSHLLHFHPVGGTITPLPTCCRSIAYALMFLSATRALNYSFLSALSTCKTLSITSVTCKL